MDKRHHRQPFSREVFPSCVTSSLLWYFYFFFLRMFWAQPACITLCRPAGGSVAPYSNLLPHRPDLLRSDNTAHKKSSSGSPVYHLQSPAPAPDMCSLSAEFGLFKQTSTRLWYVRLDEGFSYVQSAELPAVLYHYWLYFYVGRHFTDPRSDPDKTQPVAQHVRNHTVIQSKPGQAHQLHL